MATKPKRQRDRRPTEREVKEFRRELLAEVERRVEDYRRAVVVSAK